MTHSPDWNRARRLAHSSGQALPSVSIRVAAADTRVLAEQVHARTPLPPHDASAMDGWAVSGAGPWTVIGEVRAGSVADVTLLPGQAVRIATGAVLPPGTSGIVRSEHGAMNHDGQLEAAGASPRDIRHAGEEAEVGTVLITAGTRLTPAHLGLVAAVGHDTVTVIRRPTARYLVLGDELLRSGEARDGKVRDSLGPQVPSWLTRLGVDVVSVTWVEDSLDAHVTALENCTDVDIVVTSGGTARGPVDLLRTALELTAGRLVVDTVAVRPGHPMAMGRWEEPRWLLGLPGNPQAAIAALLTLGSPLVAALNGQPLPGLARRTITEHAATRGGVTRLILCSSSGSECTPQAFIGSGMLRGLAAADGYAVIPPTGAAMGDEVGWLPLPG